tara:strand:+ start:209 stop:691 length:483 start_codon:yes stop_codon:yes gene_type:complete
VLRQLKQTLGKQLTQGLGVHDCQRATGMALTISIFPILGISTPVNTGAAYLLRLNQPVVLAINFTTGPLKLAMIYPFLRFGEWIFKAEPLSLSLYELTERFATDWREMLIEFSASFMHATVGWLVCAPLLYFGFFWISKPLILSTKAAYQKSMQASQAES